jgi:hypothetical protein
MYRALKDRVVLARQAGIIEETARSNLREVMVQLCLHIVSTTIPDPVFQSQRFEWLYKDLQKDALLQYWFEGVIKAQNRIAEEKANHVPWFEDRDVSMYDESEHPSDTAETSRRQIRRIAPGSAVATMSAEEVRAFDRASDRSAEGSYLGGRSQTLASRMRSTLGAFPY